MSAALPIRPNNRRGFRIGIICALSIEADVIEAVFDKDWIDDGVKYGKAEGDLNTYTTGVIAGYNVVLAYCPSIGGNAAAQVAIGLRASFTEIKIVLVVGVCGVVPFHPETKEAINLGDCIISTGVVQYDLGRHGPKGFKRKDALDGLGRAGIEIRSLISKLKTRKSQIRLTRGLVSCLQHLQEQDPETTKYPGRQLDRLFISTYNHVHRPAGETCEKCDLVLGICDKDCQQLGCGDEYVLRCEKDPDLPRIHFGCFGSANKVLTSGLDRDRLASTNELIAFEAEASGVWEVYPTIVIKAACDYADGHKNGTWRRYAAAVAAAGLKATLYEIELSDEHTTSEYERHIEPNENGMGLTSNSSGRSFIYGQQINTIQTAVNYNNNQARANPQNLHLDISSINDTIRRADEVIRQFYKAGNRLRIERLSGDKLPLEQCYINLMLTNQTDTMHVESTRSVTSSEARFNGKTDNTSEQILLEEIFQPRRVSSGASIDPRRIFIQGQAGAGKTTLCKKIVHDFLHHRLGNGLFDHILWLPLRRLKSKSRAYRWPDFIQDTHFLQVADWPNIVEILSEKLLDPHFLNKTLLLLDGLDEISHRLNRDDEMREFLENIISTAPNIIITSRPQRRYLEVGRFDIEINTAGFTSSQIGMYLEYCIKDTSTIASIKEFIEQRPLIQGLLRIPIQLDAFCYSWLANKHLRKQDINTMTTLYESIVLELCKKDIQRLGKMNQVYELGTFEIEQILQDELKFLQELAFQSLLTNIIEYDYNILDSVGSHLTGVGVKLPTPFSSLLLRLSFLQSSNIEEVPTLRSYSFLHLTFQEFFAAKHFVQKWQTDEALTCLPLNSHGAIVQQMPGVFLQNQKYNSRFNMFWRFVAGLSRPVGRTTENLIKGLPDLFHELDSSPVDLLGFMHHRLLMYVWGEVSPFDNNALVSLRDEIEHKLQRWVILESEINTPRQDYLKTSFLAFESRRNTSYLIAEPEFPDRLIYRLLQHPSLELSSRVLHSLSRRQYLSPSMAEELTSLLVEKGKRQVQILATLRYQKELPQETIDSLVIFATHSEHPIRNCAIEALRAQSKLSTRTLDSLKWSLENEILPDIIECWSTKSHDFSSWLLFMVCVFDPRYSEMRWISGRTFAGCLGLIPDLDAIVLFQKMEPKLQVAFIDMWADELDLDSSRKWSNIIMALLKDKSHDVRLATVKLLQNVRDIVQIERYLEGLLPLLDDPLSSIRKAVADTLSRCDLPDGLEKALLSLLEDVLPDVRDAAVKALKSRPGRLINLSEESIQYLEMLMESSEKAIREAATQVLISQRIPPTKVFAYLYAQLTSKDVDLRDRALQILKGLQTIPCDILDTVTALASDAKPETLIRCAEVLTGASYYTSEQPSTYLQGHQSGTAGSFEHEQELSPGIWDALLKLFLDKDETIRDLTCKFFISVPYIPHRFYKTFMHCVLDTSNQAWEAAVSILTHHLSLPYRMSNVQKVSPSENRQFVSRASSESQIHHSEQAIGFFHVLVDLSNKHDISIKSKALASLAKIRNSPCIKEWLHSKAAIHGRDSRLYQSFMAIVQMLRNPHGEWQDLACDILTQISDLPLELLHVLMELWEELEQGKLGGQYTRYELVRIRPKIVKLLGAQSIFPGDIVAKLVDLLMYRDFSTTDQINEAIIRSLRSRDYNRLLHAAPLFECQALVAKFSVATTADILNQRTGPEGIEAAISKLIGQDKMFFVAPLLNDRAWKVLWILWLKLARKTDVACYRIENCLYVHRDGREIQLDLGTERIDQVLQVLEDVKKELGYIGTVDMGDMTLGISTITL